jgi:hypothetical protein
MCYFITTSQSDSNGLPLYKETLNFKHLFTGAVLLPMEGRTSQQAELELGLGDSQRLAVPFFLLW